MSNLNQRTILVVSEHADFASQLAHRWQNERVVPTFTLLDSAPQPGFDAGACDLAVIGRLPGDVLRTVLRTLELSAKPVIVVSGDAETAQGVRRESSRALVVQHNDGWAETVVLLAMEILRRVDAVNRAERAEQTTALLKCHATLGQYVIEMRHTLNNALTSVLGNSELLLLEPGAFSAGVRSQIDTIRNMALRMHEILQRFSSLEKELTFVEQQAVREHNRKPPAATVTQGVVARL
jgi:signal transduction histidine kinase